MKMNGVIAHLRERNLVSDVPPNHTIQRRQSEHRIAERVRINQIIQLDRPGLSESEGGESTHARIGEGLWIPDGDVRSPDIGSEAIERRVFGDDGEGIEALAWYRSFH
jgi:hypothetical protein